MTVRSNWYIGKIKGQTVRAAKFKHDFLAGEIIAQDQISRNPERWDRCCLGRYFAVAAPSTRWSNGSFPTATGVDCLTRFRLCVVASAVKSAFGRSPKSACPFTM